MREVREDPNSWQQKTIDNLVLPGSFWLRVARRTGKAWERFSYEYDELMVHVSNKLKLLDVSIARNSTFLGRMYNKIFGEESDFVVLDGIVVKQLFDLIGEDPPVSVSSDSKYRVDHKDLRRWYELAANAKSASHSHIPRQSETKER